jgi:cyclopropane-fatty-acyl-phospholipid synthase
MLLAELLRRVIEVGSLRLIGPDGRSYGFGDGSGPPVTIQIREPSVARRLFVNPTLTLGEAYMDGHVTIEGGSLADLMTVVCRNLERFQQLPTRRAVAKVAGPLMWLFARNPIRRSRNNVAHHYDLSGRLYELFLDKDMQYSCAYFHNDNESLEEAQANKKRHIAAKLLLDRPGLDVLDIGSGWGGLGLYLSQVADARVTGLTLSSEQHAVSNRRAKDAGVADRVQFRMQDYRETEGSFDRIVSVGMFEHVGRPHYGAFFRKVHDLLSDDGVALLHSIGSMRPPRPQNAWIKRYIFPGGYVPSLSEVIPAVERAGLWITDIEILRLHYAETLAEWRHRFEANRAEVRDLYDERFCRMWDFYLTCCEMGFRYSDLMVFQMQLTKRVDAVPITRDYMSHWEVALGRQAAE